MRALRLAPDVSYFWCSLKLAQAAAAHSESHLWGFPFPFHPCFFSWISFSFPFIFKSRLSPGSSGMFGLSPSETMLEQHLMVL